MTQWDFQNKGKFGWTGKSSFVLEVPLRHLRPSVIYSVPYDRILQRACWLFLIVVMASGIARGCVRTTATVESRKMAVILQIILGSLRSYYGDAEDNGD